MTRTRLQLTEDSERSPVAAEKSPAKSLRISRLSSNILYNFVGQGMVLLLSFVAVRYVFRRLGGESLGIIYFSLMLSAVLSAAIEMGIASTTVREISAYWPDEPAYALDLIRTASLLFWGGCGLLTLAIYCAAPWLVTNWLKLEVLHPTTATRALRILGLGAMLAFPRSLYVSLLRGLQRMEFNNLIDVSANALQQFGTIIILLTGGGLLQVAYWVSASFGLSIVAYLFVCAWFFSWKALRPGFSTSVVRRNAGYATRMASISLLSMIHTQADKAIVSKLLALPVLGYYGLAYNAASKGSLITNAIAQAAFPSLSALFKAGDRLALLSQYRKLQDLLCFGAVPVFAAIPFAAIPLLTYVFDGQTAQTLFLPLAFLSAGFYMNGTLNIPYVLSLAVGKPNIAARSNLFALFVVLPITFALVYFFGVSGAGFSWVFYHLFAYAYAVPRICSQCLNVPSRRWFAHISRVYLLLVLTYGLAWTSLQLAGRQSALSLAVGYAAASTVFLTGAYLFMGSELRESIHGLPLLRQLRSAT